MKFVHLGGGELYEQKSCVGLIHTDLSYVSFTYTALSCVVDFTHTRNESAKNLYKLSELDP